MDDWRAEVDDDAVAPPDDADGRGPRRRRPGAGARARAAARGAPRTRCWSPAADVDASGGWDAAVALAETPRLPVWAAPATGGGRIGFPEGHPHFQGVLPPAIGPVSETLAGHDLILVVGSSVFAYYPNLPGPLLPEGAALVAITSDPDEAARAPMGDAIVADVKLTLEALLGRDRAPPSAPRRAPRAAARAARGVRPDEPVGGDRRARRRLPGRRHRRARVARDDVRGPRSAAALAAGLATTSRPAAGSASRCPPRSASQLAQPDRPVVCVLGEGSAQYAIQAFWTAVAYDIPVTFLVLRNEEYAILKWFGEIEQVTGAPGLDLPALDVAAVAEGYGVPSLRVDDRAALTEALRDGIAAAGPRLVEARVAPGMAF